MINSVEVNYGKSASIRNRKRNNSYSIVEEEENDTTDGKEKRNIADFKQKPKAGMLYKTPANFQRLVSFSINNIMCLFWFLLA